MKKLLSLILMISFTMLIVSCFTQHHVVGEGAKGNRVETARTWYVLFGLVPINKVDTKEMAKGAKDYEIITQFTFVDYLIGFFTSIVSIQPMTVEVRY
ncbi:MAG: Bor family protein [Ignavibacteria bacterium]|nr:Bor family protein [Ignavibacteria bacterium]